MKRSYVPLATFLAVGFFSFAFLMQPPQDWKTLGTNSTVVAAVTPVKLPMTVKPPVEVPVDPEPLTMEAPTTNVPLEQAPTPTLKPRRYPPPRIAPLDGPSIFINAVKRDDVLVEEWTSNGRFMTYTIHPVS